MRTHKKYKHRLFLSLLLILPLSSFSQTTEIAEEPNTKSSMLNIGYKIGGHTYFGLDYEYKVSDYIGLHAGAGISGYTSGIKLHMSSCIECPHLNISFKDGGFGKIGTLGAELGARLFTFKKNGKMALFAQFGYGYLLYLTKEAKEQLFDNEAPSGIFTFGLGLSF